MKRVVILAFESVTTLDVTGPAEAFAAARAPDRKPAYQIELASVGGGERGTTSTLRICTRDLRGLRPRPTDTVLVAGGDEKGIATALGDTALIAWVRRAATVAERITSVCSGAFVLAAAGVLDGKRATTHWAACERLARMFPRVTVDKNAIFVQDGNVWTSAGVTTGIDMALAIVEEDLGRAVADSVAATLVLYARRPGFQSQFSEALVAQLSSSDPLGPAIAWIRSNLGSADVETLARATALSVRTLHRRCLEHLGITPGRLIDRLRVEHARTLLSTSNLSAKTMAALSGFGSATHMKRAFERELGVAPRDYRLLHGRPESHA